ncbi:hypothetical protein HD554DRAFT_2086618 [Boletus coccyginus]|nr:hypothetical protein HD554DRAFT_2086618 [Boletus coccyginus]
MIHELLGQLATRKETFSDNLVSVEQMGSWWTWCNVGRRRVLVLLVVLRMVLMCAL